MTVQEQEKISNLLDKVIPYLKQLNETSDVPTKIDISQIILKETGIRDYTEYDLVLRIIKAFNMDNQDRVFIPKFTDASHSDSLDMKNANACIRTIKRNLIPVLVGEAGCGKTYTAEHLGEKLLENFGKDGQILKQSKICCSGIPYNEFWGSYDAVSHVCTGAFKYIWREAEKNRNILYYVILDEMLDMLDIRQTFGGAFAVLDKLPENLIVVATGNNGVYDKGGQTYTRMTGDGGIDQNRFSLIQVHNLLENLDSNEAKLFLSKFDSNSLRYKVAMEIAEECKQEKMLSPRKLSNFMQLTDDELISDIKFGMNPEGMLLVPRPKYKEIPSYIKELLDD